MRSFIFNVLYNPRLSIYIDENILRCEVECDEELFNASNILKQFYRDRHIFGKSLRLLEQLIRSPHTKYQAVHIQKLTVDYLQNTAATLLHKLHDAQCFNLQIYIAYKISGKILKLSAKFGSISDMLNVAMFYYKTHRIRKALHVLEITKTKLVRPFLMYNSQVNREMYTEAVGGKSWSRKRRETVACDIKLKNTIIYIDELVPVQQFARQNGNLEVEIPVFVFLHFLEFLCYRHIDTLSIAALEELEVLVQYGQEPFILEKNRNISVQILVFFVFVYTLIRLYLKRKVMLCRWHYFSVILYIIYHLILLFLLYCP